MWLCPCIYIFVKQKGKIEMIIIDIKVPYPLIGWISNGLFGCLETGINAMIGDLKLHIFHYFALCGVKKKKDYLYKYFSLV